MFDQSLNNGARTSKKNEREKKLTTSIDNKNTDITDILTLYNIIYWKKTQVPVQYTPSNNSISHYF